MPMRINNFAVQLPGYHFCMYRCKSFPPPYSIILPLHLKFSGIQQLMCLCVHDKRPCRIVVGASLNEPKTSRLGWVNAVCPSVHSSVYLSFWYVRHAELTRNILFMQSTSKSVWTLRIYVHVRALLKRQREQEKNVLPCFWGRRFVSLILILHWQELILYSCQCATH